MSEVWFLTGSQGLYGPETLEQVAVQSREIADKLDGALPVSVVWKPVLLDASAILRCMREANAAEVIPVGFLRNDPLFHGSRREVDDQQLAHHAAHSASSAARQPPGNIEKNDTTSPSARTRPVPDFS